MAEFQIHVCKLCTCIICINYFNLTWTFCFLLLYLFWVNMHAECVLCDKQIIFIFSDTGLYRRYSYNLWAIKFQSANNRIEATAYWNTGHRGMWSVSGLVHIQFKLTYLWPLSISKWRPYWHINKKYYLPDTSAP